MRASVCSVLVSDMCALHAHVFLDISVAQGALVCILLRQGAVKVARVGGVQWWAEYDFAVCTVRCVQRLRFRLVCVPSHSSSLTAGVFSVDTIMYCWSTAPLSAGSCHCSF
jgi:hypothetical protein